MSKVKSSFDIVRGRRYSLGYGAVEDTTKRRPAQRRTSAEVNILTPQKREIASATARDDRRNMTILAWIVRRHLDAISRFRPHIRIEDEKVKAIVAKLLRWHAHRSRFDALARHGRNEWMRMFEACKVFSGDCGGLKTKGGKLQGIEGDRIATPAKGGMVFKAPTGETVSEEGLVFDSQHRRVGFCICKRSGTRGESLEFERVVKEQDMIFDAYWPDRFDADRGVSPLITGLNEAADVREVWEWLINKGKVSGLFGLAFQRSGPDEILPTDSEEDEDEDAPTTEPEAYSSQVAKGIKNRGIINLDLDEGDKVSEIESKTPYPPMIEFTRELVRSILLTLDIPFSFYDSSSSNFAGRIADRNEYEESCEWKREKNMNVLVEAYEWLFPIWEEADLFGFGKALRSAKMSAEEVAASVGWVGNGRPWMDRAGEMAGHILALSAGATSIPRICSAYGDDAFELADEQKKFLEKCGIPILYAQGGQSPVNDLLKEARNGKDETN